jgi:hypothetical protein
MSRLSRMIGSAFKAPATKKPDVYRKEREEAKRLASICGCEIERCGSGWNVWPPKESATGSIHPGTLTDPFDGDHYCQDWREVLEMVKHWAKFDVHQDRRAA